MADRATAQPERAARPPARARPASAAHAAAPALAVETAVGWAWGTRARILRGARARAESEPAEPRPVMPEPVAGESESQPATPAPVGAASVIPEPVTDESESQPATPAPVEPASEQQPAQHEPVASAAHAARQGDAAPVDQPAEAGELEPDALLAAAARGPGRRRSAARASAPAADRGPGGGPRAPGRWRAPARALVRIGATPALAPSTDGPAWPVAVRARGPPRTAQPHEKSTAAHADAVAPLIQAKLSVGAADDAYERAADAVAARVVAGGPGAAGSGGDLVRARPRERGPPTGFPDSVAAALRDRGGRPLEPALRARIEPYLGADLAHVRVRQAPAAARDLNARAFTSGATIYLAAGSSPHDVALMAHEAAHVVQQGAASDTPSIQRLEATDLIPDWILDGVRDAVRALPGYTILTTIVGEDLLTGEPAAASPQELVEKLLTYGPFGAAVGPLLQTIDVLGDVFSVLSAGLRENDLTLARIGRDIETAWNEFSISNGISGNLAIVERLVAALLRDVASFVAGIVERVLELVRAVVAEVAEPLLQTPQIAPIWNLTKKVLHHDPLRGEPVEAPTVEIIADFLHLIGEDERLAQMQERGTLQETADWLDTQFATFESLIGELGGLFADAWAAISPENLPDLMTNLEALAQRAFGFVARVGEFAATLILKVLELIKDALLAWLSEHAHTIPGFHLLTVILEQNPFTGEAVERTARNLIRGFITLVPGGEATYDQLAESGVIDQAAERIESAMTRLGISVELITGIFLGIWNELTLDDLLDPIGAFGRILALFGEPLARLVAFVVEVIQVVVTLVLRLMNFPSELLGSIIANTVAAIETIAADPVGFLLRMLEALKLGFASFFDHILTHLLSGLAAWLFRGLGQLGIQIPTDFSLASILNLVFQVLGLTVEHLWEKLGEHIGAERVAMIRSAIDTLTGIWTFVQDVQRDGIAAVWRFISDQLGNLWQTLLDMATEWIMGRVIAAATRWLLSLLDPTGIVPVINSCIAFFNAVQSAIEYLRDILEIINLYVTTLAQIAAGNIAPGAQMLEQALANAIPIAIGFLAAQVGLGNIPEKIVEIIGRIREVVDRALDWLITQALRLGQAILNALGLGGEGAEDRSPEGRKRAALEEVRRAMAPPGIRRSQLVRLLADQQRRHQLRRCELRGEATVVVENSAEETVQGELVFSQADIEQATGVAHRLPGRRGSRDVVVGAFRSTGETLPTVRGLLDPHREGWASWSPDTDAEDVTRVRWSPPLASLEPSAFRPRRVTGSVRGVLGMSVSLVDRDSQMTNVVGDMGDVEHAVRENLKGSFGKNFVGGHIIAHQLGGPETFENLVPMRTRLNDPVYKAVEQYVIANVPTIPPGRDPEEYSYAVQMTYDMTYPADVMAVVPQLAHMVATEIGGGVRGRTLTPDEVVAMTEARRALRASVARVGGQPVRLPARIPTSIAVVARFTQQAPVGTPPPTVTAANVSRTLDPIITGGTAPATAAPATPTAPAPVAGAPLAPGPEERSWSFAQAT